MKNIRAYLMIAVVSLMLVVVSAFLLSGMDHTAAVAVPLLFGFIFTWSAVQAVIAKMEENDSETKTLTFTLRVPEAA